MADLLHCQSTALQGVALHPIQGRDLFAGCPPEAFCEGGVTALIGFLAVFTLPPLVLLTNWRARRRSLPGTGTWVAALAGPIVALLLVAADL